LTISAASARASSPSVLQDRGPQDLGVGIKGESFDHAGLDLGFDNDIGSNRMRFRLPGEAELGIGHDGLQCVPQLLNPVGDAVHYPHQPVAGEDGAHYCEAASRQL
jgi:hypothetical protein